MTNSEIIFSCEHLCFSYQEEKPVLRDVSLSIKPGERIVLLGENGSGKSTLFKLMTAVIEPKEGKLFWFSEPYQKKNKFLKKLYSQIGFVFQDPDDQLFAASVEQEVSFGAVNLGLKEGEVRTRVNKALELTNITRYKDEALENLSFGERKRVSIADLLVMDSRLLLLDEPTAWLDNKNSTQITEVLDKLNQDGVALMCSTHDVDWAWSFADRIIIIHDGHISFDGSPEAAFNDPDFINDMKLKMPSILEFQAMLKRIAEQGKDLGAIVKQIEQRPLPRCIEDLKSRLDNF